MSYTPFLLILSLKLSKQENIYNPKFISAALQHKFYNWTGHWYQFQRVASAFLCFCTAKTCLLQLYLLLTQCIRRRCTQDLQGAKLICPQCVSGENNFVLKVLLEWRYQDADNKFHGILTKINPSTGHIVVEKTELYFPSNFHTTQKCEVFNWRL